MCMKFLIPALLLETCNSSIFLGNKKLNKFNERLRSLLKSKKISGKELAEQLKVTAVKVSRWLTGKNQPDYDELCRLCKIFGVSTDYLINGKEFNLKFTSTDRKLLKLSEDKKELLVKLLGL